MYGARDVLRTRGGLSPARRRRCNGSFFNQLDLRRATFHPSTTHFVPNPSISVLVRIVKTSRDACQPVHRMSPCGIEAGFQW